MVSDDIKSGKHLKSASNTIPKLGQNIGPNKEAIRDALKVKSLKGLLKWLAKYD